MKPIHRKRLLNVAKALRESANPKAFSMEFFAWGGRWILHPCGTPACAVGHYAARRDLQRTFRITKNGSLPFADEDSYSHFGIDGEEYDALFSAVGCGNAKTTTQAARYIERFVKRKERGP